MSLKRFLRKIQLPCEDVSELISRACDENLSPPQSLAMKFHLLYCAACRRYRKQLDVLDEAAKRLAAQADPILPEAPPTLSDEARERIRRSLHE